MKPDEFRRNRETMTARVLATGHTGIRRFFALDHQAYEDGALPAKTKELGGLAASAVLRCDDCIAWHLDRCVKLGATNEEITEMLNIALIVGGSVVIPHLRRAFAYLDACRGR